VPAYTRRWTKTRDTPAEQTYEAKPYHSEIMSDTPDMTPAADRHAQQQLQLQRQYPGRDRPKPSPIFKQRINYR
jgi:hypothetical protein